MHHPFKMNIQVINTLNLLDRFSKSFDKSDDGAQNIEEMKGRSYDNDDRYTIHLFSKFCIN